MDNQDIKSELIKIAPPVGVSTVSIMGLSLSEAVLLTTLVYTLVQTTWLVYKIYKHFRGKPDGK